MKLISRFSKSGDWKNFALNEKRIGVWESKISNNQSIIDKVLGLRDKVYAHTDSTDNLNLTISFKEIEILLNLAEEILKEIYNVALENHLIAKSTKFDMNRFPILKLLILGEEEFKKQIMLKYARRS